jgi:hypothetical protein
MFETRGRVEKKNQKDIETYVLLDLELLKLDELGPTALQVQPSAGLVDAAVVARADAQRREAQRVDGLERLGAALVARVRGNLEQGLHVRGASDDPLDGDELPDVLGLHVADGEVLGRARETENQLAVKRK